MLWLYVVLSILLFVSFVTVIILAYYLTVFQYWKKKGVPHVTPTIPYGNIKNPKRAKKPITLMLQNVYNVLKSEGHKFGGHYTFTAVQYLPIHPDYVKAVMSSDFSNFINRGIYSNESKDPLSAHLISLEGQQWKNLRQKLTPGFTSGKFKAMFKTLNDCGGPMLKAMERKRLNGELIDFKQLLGCFTIDVIGTCAFGIECNSFENESPQLKQAFDRVLKPKTLEAYKDNFSLIFPRMAKRLGLVITPPDVSEFILKLVKDTVEYRKQNDVMRHDFLQILMELMEVDQSITIEQVAAQVFIFFLAGFDTSSTTMSLCLYELAHNQDIQDKARNEIFEMLENNGGEISYDGIVGLQYLHQVIEETLRKYPPVPQLNRMCNADYKIPGTEIIIEKDTIASICVYGMQHDPEFFPSPETFDPDRFSKENKPKIVPYTYLPFGEGPRQCIGLRFAHLQITAGIFAILKNYRLTPNGKTENPLSWDPMTFLLSTKGGIYLNVEKI